jgi:DNA repair protein RecN (Recombination protein N)
MLTELRINNFAIIDHLELQFGSGLITFTGETGAGKSILIDAVETLLGGRAESTMIRSGAKQALIEGVFKISSNTPNQLHLKLEDDNLLDDPEYLTLGREIRMHGPNIARVNGRTVSAALLREIGANLIDVHTQSEHLSLLRVSHHLDLLDNYAGVKDLLDEYQRTYKRLGEVRRDLSALREAERDSALRTDTLTYQINEIESAQLQSAEEGELRNERNRLANAEALATLSQEALMLLDEGTPESPSATDLLGQVTNALSNLSRLDKSQSVMNEQANSMFDSLTDLSRQIRTYLERIEFNPRRLDQVEERLALIHNLKRKYGNSIDEVIAYAQTARNELDMITHAGERILELEADEIQLLTQLGQDGEALSAKRSLEAEKLGRELERELADLQMPEIRFKVDFQRRSDPEGVILVDGSRIAFGVNGLERVEFLIAPNPGEGFKPLAKIASGGETSRLMLALKNVLISADAIPTLIFDEIDQGIGGRVGGVVGQKLWSLSQQHQVLCVTHLPQLAAYGAQHYHVEKRIDKGRTMTGVESLQGSERVRELAQMLGGVSDGTVQSAHEILEQVEVNTTLKKK